MNISKDEGFKKRTKEEIIKDKGISNLVIQDTKKSKRKTPEIEDINKEIPFNKTGAKLEIKGFKALKLVVDDVEIEEKDFAKLFPSVFSKFVIKITEDFSKGVKELYMYFPKSMIEKHSIKVMYRQKMKRYIYNAVISDKENKELEGTEIND